MSVLIRTCLCMALCFSFCVSASQLYGQVVYSISGFANNGPLFSPGSSAPEVSADEMFVAEFVIDTDVLDSDSSPDRGEYPSAILSASIQFEGGYTSQVDYAGGDITIQRDLDGGGVFLSDVNGANTILIFDLNNPFDSDALLTDPAMQFNGSGDSFFYLNEPTGGISSFSDVNFDPQSGGAGGPIAFAVISQPVDLVVLGDCNEDGEVTFDDIPPMIDVLINGSYLAQADCNGDESVDFGDIGPFIQILNGN